jgi:His/Glu/Gln/Arg/opine family amino acid ABC transporter permease subunit
MAQSGLRGNALEGILNLLARGAVVTVAISSVGIFFGTLLAIALAAMPFSRWRGVAALYRAYIFVIRGTPMLVQAFLVFYGLPALGLRLGPYTAGIAVLTLYASALFAEIFRGAVLSVPRGILESAASLGLRPILILRKVAGPLALRYALPSYVSMCVTAVKASSVLSVIGVWELTLASREITERTLQVFTVMALAAAFYFCICFSLDRLGRALERRLSLAGG